MFTIQTTYNQKALTVMACALRKTLRKRHSILTRIFTSALIAVFILFVASYFLIGEAGENIFTLAFYIGTIVILSLIMLMEDNLNGWIAGKQMLPNAKEAQTFFEADNYTNATAAIKSACTYEQIKVICETKGYIVFFLSKKHGQVFDKKGFQNGDLQSFRTFIMDKTGKAIQYIK